MIPLVSRMATAWTVPSHRRARSRKAIRIEAVLDAAAKHGVTTADIYGRSRTRAIARARHAAMQQLRSEGFSYPEIADALGVHHSSVMYACRAKPRTVGG